MPAKKEMEKIEEADWYLWHLVSVSVNPKLVVKYLLIGAQIAYNRCTTCKTPGFLTILTAFYFPKIGQRRGQSCSDKQRHLLSIRFWLVPSHKLPCHDNFSQTQNIRILFSVFCQSQNIANSGRTLFPLLTFPATYIMKSDRWKEGKIEFCTLATTCCEMGRGWPPTSSIEKWCSDWDEYCNTTRQQLKRKVFIPNPRKS